MNSDRLFFFLKANALRRQRSIARVRARIINTRKNNYPCSQRENRIKHDSCARVASKSPRANFGKVCAHVYLDF